MIRPHAAPTNLSIVARMRLAHLARTMMCSPMSAAAGSSGNSGAIGGTTPLAATIMCQSSTSSTTSGPFHHDLARSCAVVRSGGGSRFQG